MTNSEKVEVGEISGPQETREKLPEDSKEESLGDFQGESGREGPTEGVALSRRAQKKAAFEEIKKILKEENVEEVDEEEKGKLTEIDQLTGCPFQDDVLLYAVPVCAPYSVLQKYKYKVKLTPGTTKKGKGLLSFPLPSPPVLVCSPFL